VWEKIQKIWFMKERKSKRGVCKKRRFVKGFERIKQQGKRY
jgi:hypothetical protein